MKTISLSELDYLIQESIQNFKGIQAVQEFNIKIIQQTTYGFGISFRLNDPLDFDVYKSSQNKEHTGIQ
jgi:hypothetical protein